jgi:phenylpropionate dioxygenase-like ring-hydroxylating dioxygenase large terminal subunit
VLSEKDNALLTGVGPGTPMGGLFRRHWLPCLTSAELPEPDCPPVRLRLLGEDLVAFRDTEGRPGILEAYCPHRRANLFWGRNEESGLRCVYHGWKFDVAGRCMDMPSEPAERTFKDRVGARAYPARENAGFVWIYMGPPELEPELPQYEWTLVPDSHLETRRWFQDSNWLQSLEGDIDTSHVSFLHRFFDTEAAPPPQFVPGYRRYVTQDKSPTLTVHETPYGFVYGGRRTIGEDYYYWRLTHWLAPSCSQTPGSTTRSARILVPIDDQTTFSCSVVYSMERPLEEAERRTGGGGGRGTQTTSQPITLKDGYVIDGWVPSANRDNDYLIDRQRQRTTNFSGMATGPVDEDRAVTETMKPVVDRSQEHLGTSDVAIIAARRRLLRMLRDLEQGVEPPGLRQSDVYAVRSIDVLSANADFDAVLAEHAHELASSTRLVAR